MSPSQTRGKILIAKLRQFNLFACMLDHYLRAKGVLQAHLARRIPVAPAAVRNWRDNERLPDLGMFYCICRALGLTEDEQENLLFSWEITVGFRALIPYVKAAEQAKDLKTIALVENRYVTTASKLDEIFRLSELGILMELSLIEQEKSNIP